MSNTTKLEQVLITRDPENKPIQITMRKEGTSEYEIYKTVATDLEDVQDLYNNKTEPKL